MQDTKEEPVDDAENRGCRADCQSDYQNCGERKSGIRFKLAEGKVQAESERFHPGGSVLHS